MTILLNLSYNTVFGEQLVANFIKGDKPEDIVKQRMNTVNGSEWTCRVNTPEGTDAVCYYYSVEKNGVLSRQEWQLQPHSIKLSASQSETFTAYDHWNDIPEDAYMYSSAITDCVAKRTKSKSVKSTSTKAVIIKTKAPQLRASERLAIMGSDKVLGEWEAMKAYPMEEFAPNEWMTVIDAKKLKSNRLEFKFVALNEKTDYTPLWETRDNRIVDIPELKDGETVVYELDIAFFPIFAWKAAGVVVPIFSLRSEGSFGVGDFGDLKMMVGWAAKTHQRVIQILPIYDTTITNTWTDSYPYNSISIYALHPQYADLRQLPELKDEEARERMEALRKELNALPQIDYERVNNAKREYLRLLFEQEFAAASKKTTYKKFFEDNKEWLVPYAAFSHYRDIYGTATFSQWPDHHSLPEDEREKLGTPGTKEYKSVAFWYYVQYILDTQLRDAHSYAQSNRVLLKGDIPIGISRDGVEAWVEPKYFNLNGQAGAPPDAFSANGQNWGFPTYNWDAMLEDGCSWWVRRFRKMAEFFDAYRIDHVLGFFRIWEIPSHAVHGLLGQFAPALAMTKEEIEGYGLRFDEDRYTRPFITDWTLDRIFHEHAAEVKEMFLDRLDDERYQMKPEYDTQRKVEAWYKGIKNEELRIKSEELRIKNEELRIKSEETGFFDRWIRTSPASFCNTTDKAVLKQVLNDYDQETPDFYRWRVEYTQEELSRLIAEKTKDDFGYIIDLIPVERGKSGRICRLKIIGTKKTLTIGKELEIRRTLSDTHLYSSAFVVDKHYAEGLAPEDRATAVPVRFTIIGAGWGHGVGLCQIGAAVMGEKGYPYDKILLHYYSGAEIKKFYM